MANHSSETQRGQPETFNDWSTEILRQMKTNPGDCNLANKLAQFTGKWLYRAPGATMDGMENLYAEIWDIHNPYCPKKTPHQPKVI